MKSNKLIRMDQKSLIKLRRKFHRYPELSGSEMRTSKRIGEILNELNPDDLLTGIGGHGVAARFSATGQRKETILFRAELDAIAVDEETELEYGSSKKGVMHGCGHDGHMTILLGLASKLHRKRQEDKDVWILFQPSEENGKGAAQMLADPKFDQVEADCAFALHNLPGFPENRVLVKEDVFAAASTGLDVKFKGKSSHAAYPEQGVNPSAAVADLLLFADREFDEYKSKNPLNKIVTAYVKVGEKAFGISPGEGSVGFTLRSVSDEDLQDAIKKLNDKVSNIKAEFEGEVTLEEVEPFAVTVNHTEGVERVIAAADQAGLEWDRLEKPFPWSEDFGQFRKKFPITLFGLGSGEDHAPLHSERYDFNDELIESGIHLFMKLIES